MMNTRPRTAPTSQKSNSNYKSTSSNSNSNSSKSNSNSSKSKSTSSKSNSNSSNSNSNLSNYKSSSSKSSKSNSSNSSNSKRVKLFPSSSWDPINYSFTPIGKTFTGNHTNSYPVRNGIRANVYKRDSGNICACQSLIEWIENLQVRNGKGLTLTGKNKGIWKVDKKLETQIQTMNIRNVVPRTSQTGNVYKRTNGQICACQSKQEWINRAFTVSERIEHNLIEALAEEGEFIRHQEAKNEKDPKYIYPKFNTIGYTRSNVNSLREDAAAHSAYGMPRNLKTNSRYSLRKQRN